MKRMIVVGTVMAAAVTGSFFSTVAIAASGEKLTPEKSCGCPKGEPGKSGDGFLQKMAKDLNLTGAQQEQVKAIITADREKNSPLMEKMEEKREQLFEAATAEKFDEAAVRTLAVQKAELEVEMAVSRAKIRNSINAILTPEQRAKAEKMRPQGAPGRRMMPPPPEDMPRPEM
ncbi:MAG: Spy/CpxP family protein refolding chaperone [Geobacteraceae bacterium]|nr:Spy/CpxP family protein refolding chaperone [Geobacteraceae bacterium]